MLANGHIPDNTRYPMRRADMLAHPKIFRASTWSKGTPKDQMASGSTSCLHASPGARFYMLDVRCSLLYRNGSQEVSGVHL